jgi:hypothetical protein
MHIVQCPRMAMASALAFCFLPTAAPAGPLVVEETARLTSPEPNRPFTGPIAIHGNLLAVASEQPAPKSPDSICAVFVYERATSAAPWRFIRKLTEFRVDGTLAGSYLALDATANAVAISARWYAAVFEKTSSGWVERKLAGPSVAVDYPSDIAISGSTAAVGGTSNSDITGFVFQKSAAGSWLFQTELRADLQPFGDIDYLGERLDIDGNYAALVSPGRRYQDEPRTGHLFVFRRNDAGQWSQAVLLNDPTSPTSPNGEAVSALSLSASRGVAAFPNTNYGASVFTETSPGNWSTIHTARPLDAAVIERSLFSSPLELARYQNRAALVMGQPSDHGRGRWSGSVGLFAPSTVLGPWRHLIEFMASDARESLGLGSPVAFHGDTVAAIGDNSVYLFRVPTSVAQPEIFQDDFEDGESVGWLRSSGNWTVATSRGSRVYRQASSSGEHVTTRSGINWGNVAIEADIRPTAFNGNDRWVSLMTRYVDDQNYYYVALRNTNVLRLAKRVGNTFTTLGSISLPVTVNRTYHVRLEAVGTWIRAYVDGELRIQARDTTHARGGVGMKTANAAAEFDNVLVSPNPLTTLFATDFTNPPDEWLKEPEANWRQVQSGTNWVLRQTSSTQVSRVVTGLTYESDEPELANHTIEARVRALNFGTAGALFGVMARYRDVDNYMSAVLTRDGTILLRQQSNGTTRTLDSATVSVAANTWYTLRLEAIDDRVRVYLNDVHVLETRDATIDNTNTRGRYGLLTVGTSAEFDDVVSNEP